MPNSRKRWGRTAPGTEEYTTKPVSGNAPISRQSGNLRCMIAYSWGVSHIATRYISEWWATIEHRGHGIYFVHLDLQYSHEEATLLKPGMYKTQSFSNKLRLIGINSRRQDWQPHILALRNNRARVSRLERSASHTGEIRSFSNWS